MSHVIDVYNSGEAPIGQTLAVQGVLLCSGPDNQFIADSLEDYDRGIAIQILECYLFERLFERGLSPIGGGRFAFRCNAVIEGMLVHSEQCRFAFGMKNLSRLTVSAEGREIAII